MGQRLVRLLAVVLIALALPSVSLSDAGQQQVKTSEFEVPAFFATTLINLPTTKCIEKGEVLFRVSHRFYWPSNSGYQTFYGLDGPAYIFLSLGYGISDNWSISLGRTNLRQEVELSSAFSLFQQGESHGLPFSAVLIGNANLTTQVPEGTRVFSHKNVRLSAQASLSHQFTNKLSVLIVPSFSSNTDYSRPGNQNTFGLGIGGRAMILENISLVAEVVPVPSGFKTGVDEWGFGIEVKKGGHVFHIFLNNAYGLTPNQYLPGGDLKLADGNVRYGFNIYRSF